MPEQDPYHPHPLATHLIQWLCREDLWEEILGNLYEYHMDKVNAQPGIVGRLKFWYEVISYIRPSTLKKVKNLNRIAMFHFNLILTFRHLWKNKAYTAINLAGFSLGMICVTILYFYINQELNYDAFHTNKDRIYRVLRTSDLNGDKYDVGVTSGPFAGALMNDYPNVVKDATRVAQRKLVVRYENNIYHENKFHFADQNFYEFFSFPLVTGNPKSVLESPNAVVISESMARKYFGNDDPIGKTLLVDNEHNFIVTGVMKDITTKSHLEISFVASLNFYKNSDWIKRWWWNGLMTYVLIDTPGEMAQISSTFPQFMDKYFKDDFEQSGHRIGLRLESLNDIHFNDTRFDFVQHGSKNTVYTLGIVAFCILLVACFNYLNLSLAASFQRTREISIRKVLGTNRSRLMLQFLGESLIVVISAILLAIVSTEFLMPVFNSYFDLDISVVWMDGQVILFYFMILIGTILLSGWYPAWILSSYQISQTLQSKGSSGGRNLTLRKALVTAQFAISTFMIIATWLISSQMDFVSNKKLGFNDEAIMVISLNNSGMREKQATFEKKLESIPQVVSFSTMTGEPGGFHDATTLAIKGSDNKNQLQTRTVFCDYDYLSTFDIKLKAGRNFSEDRTSEMNRVAIINETALKSYGWTLDEAIGKRVQLDMFDTLDREIIGVAEDYHFSSLKDEIEPIIMALSSRDWSMAVKLNPGSLKEGVENVQGAWEELIPAFPFTFKFLDDKLDLLYQDEAKQNKVFEAFAGISIFLACLGIFGLVSHTATQKRKEIGIRKVLGADVVQIILLISKEFLILITIAYAISIPLSWYFMDGWLATFAYKIQLSGQWFIFLLSGVVALIISMLTISFRSISSALANPVDSLRYE